MTYQRPDSRVRLSWAVAALVVALVPAALSVVLFRLSFIPRLVAWLFTGLWIVLLLLLLTVYIPLRYRQTRYLVSEQAVTVISGVYFVSHHTLPLSGVRHITVIRGPLERLFGLAFVVFSAAGGWVLVEGVPAADAEAWSHRLLASSTPPEAEP